MRLLCALVVLSRLVFLPSVSTTLKLNFEEMWGGGMENKRRGRGAGELICNCFLSLAHLKCLIKADKRKEWGGGRGGVTYCSLLLYLEMQTIYLPIKSIKQCHYNWS